MQQVKNNIGYIILAIAAVVIVVVAWFKATPASAPTVDQPATSTVQRETELPDFANIEERNGERVLVNERDGYELVLEENWSVYEDDFTGGISVQDFVEPEPGYGGLPGCRADIVNLNGTLEEEINNQKNSCDLLNCDFKQTKSSNDNWTVVSLNGDFVGTSRPIYLREVNNRITQKIIFQCINQDFTTTLMEGFNYET